MSTMIESMALKPLHRVLSQLTGEDRFDVALHLATKELAQLRLQESHRQIKSFEDRYGMNFDQFQRAWESGAIPAPRSYEVEKDYWEWEAALTDRERLNEILANLP